MADEPAAVPTPPSAERTLATAALVLDIATAAAGELELDAILHAALDRLRGVVAFTGGSIALVDGDDLVIRAATGPFEGEALGQRLPRGPSRSWAVVRDRDPVNIGDLFASGSKVTGATASTQVRSWLAVPIERRGDGIGLLEVDSTDTDAFSADDLALLRTVGQALAGPVELAARYASERQGRTLRDAFTGVISHELRTPITTIYGMSKVLRQRLGTMTPEAIRLAIEDIEEEADRLHRLTEDLLVLSRSEGGPLTLSRDPLAMARVVRRAVETEAARHLTHRFEVAAIGSLPLVLGEESYVGQVLQNLLSNAAKYSPVGSTITTTAEAIDDAVAVRVQDQGPGFSAETGAHLFELFYRAPEATRQAAGAGIGLFVCRQLVEAMGGRIWAEPMAGGGSEFGFSLPAATEEDDGDD